LVLLESDYSVWETSGETITSECRKVLYQRRL
jgi:hypothetical protein